MKKLVVFFVVIILSLSLFSCNKNDDPVVDNSHRFDGAWYKLVVYANDDRVEDCYFTFHTEPMDENLDGRGMHQDGNMFYFLLSLASPEHYEGQTVKIDIRAYYRDKYGEWQTYEKSVTIILEITFSKDDPKVIEFVVP